MFSSLSRSAWRLKPSTLSRGSVLRSNSMINHVYNHNARTASFYRPFFSQHFSKQNQNLNTNQQFQSPTMLSSPYGQPPPQSVNNMNDNGELTTAMNYWLQTLDERPVSKNEVRREVREQLTLAAQLEERLNWHANRLVTLEQESKQDGGNRQGGRKWVEYISVFGNILFIILILSILTSKTGVAGALGDNYEEYDSKGNIRREKNQGGLAGVLKGIFGMDSTPEIIVEEGDIKSITFNDVCGCNEAKAELQDMVDYLRDPSKFQELDLSLPKGVLMAGPPGCGKTLLAKAMAYEAGIPLLVADGSGFDQMFVGLGAQRVRSLFKRAREIAPCIVFIDEIDAVASRRDEPMNKTRQTLNALLVEMDGIKENNGVVVIGATNMVDMLDPAVKRSGRFDREVHVELPDKAARVDMFEFYLKDKKGDDVDANILAKSTTGLSGADISTLVNMAGMTAVKDKRNKISMVDLVDAIETISMGRARDKVIDEATRNICAYHESGHALVAIYTQESDVVYKATLTPRGPALGMVSLSPKDELLMTKAALLARMDVAMGGRAAEHFKFGLGKVTQGASSDFQGATNIATAMVTKMGMSEKVGKVYYSDRQLRELDSDTLRTINCEIKRLLDESYVRAMHILKKHHRELESLSLALLERDTLPLDEIKKVIDFKEKDVIASE